MFVHLIQCAPQVWFVLGSLLYIFIVQEWFWHCTWTISTFVLIFFASYNCVCIDMFVYVIQSSCWLWFILGILSYISPMYGLFSHCIVFTFTFVLICIWILYLIYFNMLVYFIRSDPWLYSILGILSWIFPVYDFLCHCCHTSWPAFTIVG